MKKIHEMLSYKMGQKIRLSHETKDYNSLMTKNGKIMKNKNYLSQNLTKKVHSERH